MLPVKLCRKTRDGCYSWLILAASVVTNLLTIGFLFGSVGALVSEYNKEFGVDIRTSSWAGSTLTGVVLLSGPLAAYFVGKLGCRLVAVAATCLNVAGLMMSAFATNIWVVVFTFSILSGFASSCCHVATMKILTQYFNKYQHLAYATAAVGSDLATVIFPFIVWFILDSLSYKYSILTLAAILVPAIPCGVLYIEQGIDVGSTTLQQNLPDSTECQQLSPDNSNSSKSGKLEGEITPQTLAEPQHTLKDHMALLSKPLICIFLLNTMLWNCGGSMVGILVYSYYLDIGLTDTMASTGMMCYGIGSLFGSISLALISWRFSFNRLLFHWMLNLLLAVFLFVFPSIGDSTLMAVALAMFGLSYGTLCANLGSLTEHINGSKSLYLVYSYEMAAGGIGSLIGPGVSAYLQKTYSSAIGFYFGAGVCTAALLSMVVYTLFNRGFLKPAASREGCPHTTNEVGHSNLSLAARL